MDATRARVLFMAFVKQCRQDQQQTTRHDQGQLMGRTPDRVTRYGRHRKGRPRG